jgi:glucosamine--fructose-6-phosphate aminotransferase (isomerizing)
MNLQSTDLFREIHEQPETLHHLITTGLNPIYDLAQTIQKEDIHHIVVAARGTSDNAGRYAQYLLGMENQLLVTLSTPSLFSIYQRPPDLRHTLVLGISQSGKSPDLVRVLQEGRRQGAVTAAITNYADSDMAATADHVIPLLAGAEKSLAATKTYTAEVTAIAALSAILSGNDDRLKEMDKIPAAIEAILAQRPSIEQIAERYCFMQRCVVIGRGLNYATAFEFSLKLKELTYTVAEPYSSADFQHGPMAVVDRGFPVFIFTPSGVMLPELRELIDQLKQRSADLIVISNDEEVCKHGTRALFLPTSFSEQLSPITAIVPGQLFAMHLAATRGIDVDHPRGLNKVTETL